MESGEITLKGFLQCFKNINFLVTKKPIQVKKQKTPDSVQDSIYHLQKMLAKAKKDLSKAVKSHRAGKLSIEDVMDHEYHVHELNEEIKKIIEINNDLSDELS